MKCYLCGSEKNKLITEKLRYKIENNGKIYKCNNCGLYFIYPRMTDEQEKRFYEKEYGEIFSSEKGIELFHVFEKCKKDAEIYYKLCKNYLRSNYDCLEVGSSSGFFLAKIKDMVKSVTGVEIHNLSREYANKNGIKTVANVINCDDQYNLIFMIFILEHVRDPINFLKQVKPLLKSNGRIFILVPNIEDILISTYKINGLYEFYFTPAHQFYYSEKTLSLILQKAGFSDFQIKHYQRYDLSNHIHWMMTGKPGGKGKYSYIFNEKLDNEYANCLVQNKISDTLYAIINDEKYV